MALDLEVGSYLLPESFGYSTDRIEYAGHGPNGIRWAVRSGSLCLSRALEWDHEPLPSSSLRTMEWYHQHRFDTPEEAYVAWKKWARRMEDDGK